MSELVEWFKKRRAEKVADITQRHLSLVTGAVDCLVDFYKALIERNGEVVKDRVKKINDMEKEADTLRRMATRELSRGVLSPSIREDLMDLARRTDEVMGWITGTARNGRFLLSFEFPKEMRDTGAEMMKITKECVWTTRKCVDRLYGDPKEARKLTALIEQYEHEVDDLFTKIKRIFAGLTHDDLTLGSAIMLFEFFLSLETISDRCEDVSDLVGILTVRYAE